MTAYSHWQNVFEKNKTCFDETINTSFIAVADTQFGDGACFSAFWQAFQQSSQKQKRCHYMALVDQLPDSTSLHLSGVDDLFQQELIRQWPIAIEGYHRLILQQGQLVLTLVVGDRQNTLSLLTGTFHHWLIHDIPSWTVHDIKRLGLHCQFNSHCWISALIPTMLPWLKEAGFTLAATYDKPSEITVGRYTRQLAFQHRSPVNHKHAIIVGAGLAGSTMCERLTERGWRVDLIEAAQDIAQGASGNLGGVFMPMLSKDDNAATQLIRTAFFYAQQLWREVGGIGQAIDGEQCGVLQVARDKAQEQTFQEIAQQLHYPETYAQCLTQAQATQKIGLPTQTGYFFPKGGWLNPASVCRAMLAASEQHTGEHTLRVGCAVASIAYHDNAWCVKDRAGRIIAQAPTLILANGMDALRFMMTSSPLLQPIWGQVTHIPAQALPELPVVMTGDGYLTRPYQGVVSMGATYNKTPLTGISYAGHLDNLNKLKQFLPTIDISPDQLADHAGRVGVRCVTQDRLPLIGAIPDVTSESDRVKTGRQDTQRVPGLYSLLGYASRGLIWSPLAAEMLACHLEKEPIPVNKKLWQAVDPNRYINAFKK